MKKLFKIAVLLTIAVVLIPACSKKDNNGNERKKTPEASFRYSPATVYVNDVVTFTNTSTNASNYLWDFGDGKASTATSPTHSYTIFGDYTVTMYSADGTESDQTTANIKVLPEPVPPLTIRVNGVSFEMIYVRGGMFDMGATPEQGDDPYNDEYPVHQVTLDNYYIGKFEVTQELWQAVMDENPSWFTPGNGYNNNLQRPVEDVSWYDIVEDFLPALNAETGKNFALPTEAQWEFAARGGTKSKHYKYSGSNNIDDVTWYGEWDTGSTPHSVGQKQPNELGIYDMSGNVYEWCSDWYDSDYYQYSPSTKPQGPSSSPYSNRVLRGGRWHYDASCCRVAFRAGNDPHYSYRYLGFRLMLIP